MNLCIRLWYVPNPLFIAAFGDQPLHETGVTLPPESAVSFHRERGADEIGCIRRGVEGARLPAKRISPTAFRSTEGIEHIEKPLVGAAHGE